MASHVAPDIEMPVDPKKEMLQEEARESKQISCTVDDRRRFLNGSWETFADFKKSLHAMGLVVGQSDKQNQRYRLRIQFLKQKLMTFRYNPKTMTYTRTSGHGSTSVEEILSKWNELAPLTHDMGMKNAKRRVGDGTASLDSSAETSPAKRAKFSGTISGLCSRLAAQRAQFKTYAKGGTRPITETRNSLSSGLDLARPEQMVRIMRGVDAQVFSGYRHFAGLCDREVQESIEQAAQITATVLRSTGKRKIVISGSGTSGRVAFFVARRYETLLRHFSSREQDPSSTVFDFCISGGESAIVLSDELPEDDPGLAVRDLQAKTAGADKVLVIGVTCGLSAPYCAGQVDYAMDQVELERREGKAPKTYAVCMGFNPAGLARAAKIEKWSKRSADRPSTFLAVVERMLWKTDPERVVLLNPVVGPEVVTGSSRMKGGSVTLILLEIIFARAFQLVFGSGACNALGSPSTTVPHMVESFAETYRALYQNTFGLQRLVNAAGSALCHQATESESFVPAAFRNGNVFFIGDAGSGGALSLIDLSEMPDTYGAPFTEMRGFVLGGWRSLLATPGVVDRGQKAWDALSAKDMFHRISAIHFGADILPHLSGRGTFVLFVVSAGQELTTSMMDTIYKLGARGVQTATLRVAVQAKGRMIKPKQTLRWKHHFDVLIDLPQSSLLRGSGQHSLGDFALKLALNIVSTGAQVMAGRVFENLMINTGPTNDKIYCRCVQLIAYCAGVNEEAAEIALIRAIHGVDELSNELKSCSRGHHVQKVAAGASEASKREICLTLPTAILLASNTAKTIEGAMELLRKQKILRNILTDFVGQT